MKVGAVIQARMSSTRLPGKVLKELPYNSGITVLEQVINRVRESILIDDIAVATSTRDIDKEIVKVAKKANVKAYQGEEEDIVERWYGASKKFGFDVIVRITSDCPVIDWKIIDKTISAVLKEDLDFASPSIPSRFVPHGLDVEVFTFELLDKVVKTFSKKDRIEKRILLFTYIEGAKIKNVKPEIDIPTDIRITLDTEEDYALMCTIYDYLYYKNPLFGIEDVVKLFREKPWLKLINKKVFQKKIFKDAEEEIEEAIKLLKLNELNKAVEILQKWRT